MISKQLIKEILYSYEKTRRDNEAEHEEKLKALQLKFPRLKEIQNELESFGIEISQAVLKNPTNYEGVIHTFESASKKLLSEKAYLLTDNNIPLDYLELQYECSICHDTVYVQGNQLCQCFNQKLVEHLYQMSNIKTRIQKENFNSFNIDIFSDFHSDSEKSQKDNITHILSSLEQYVYQFNPDKSPNILFYGPTGQGKTFFCNSISKYLMDKGYVVIYQTAFKLIDIIEEYRFRSKGESSEGKYNMLLEADLLIIDDLGTEFNNSFTNTEIFNIINGRLLKNKPLIISTNLGLKEIEQVYSQRVSSRIYGSFDIYKFFGPDIRWNK